MRIESLPYALPNKAQENNPQIKQNDYEDANGNLTQAGKEMVRHFILSFEDHKKFGLEKNIHFLAQTRPVPLLEESHIYRRFQVPTN